jgi:two-component system, sensor histidine kinase and response regulator
LKKDAEERIKELEEELERCRGRLEEMADARSNELLLNQRLESEIAIRTRMETALTESEEKYRKLVENANEAIFSVNREGRVTLANKYAAEWVGCSPEEVLHKTMWDLFPPKFADPQMKTLIEVMDTGEGVLKETETLKDGEKAYIIISVQPIYGDNDKADSVLCFATDITDRKSAEEDLLSAKEEAERANRLKSEFLANMSHEIRTPLNAIIGFTDVLMEDEHEEEKQERLSIIKHSGQTLLAIINDILDLSKIEADKIVIENDSFSLHSLFEHFSTMFGKTAELKGLDFIVAVDENAPRLLYGDEKRLEQILINLLSNAFKFTHQGRVEMRCKYEESQLIILVRDTGVGIPEEKQESIFNPFEQADSSTVKQFGGTGLGLAICKRLARIMGGEITLKSAEGKGSEFCVRLPFQESESEERKIVAKEQVKVKKRPEDLRVLLAEDNPINQKLIIAILEKGGVSCDVADDGAIALDKLKHGKYDLLLLDMQMPVMDGEEVLRRIRKEENLKKIKIIALTAHALKGDEEKYLAMGSDGYISKPVNKDLLLKTVDEMVNESQISKIPSVETPDAENPKAVPLDLEAEMKKPISENDVSLLKEVMNGIEENLTIFSSEKVGQIAKRVREQGEAPQMRVWSDRLQKAADDFDEEELAGILDILKRILFTTEDSTEG